MSEKPISEDLDFYRTVSEIYNIISNEKSLRQGVKDHIHETLGRLNSMYSKVEKENCVLKTEARMNKERQTPIVHTQTYAQTTARTAAQRQQPVLPKPDKHTLFVTAEGKDAKEIRRVFTENVFPVKDKLRISKLRTTQKLLIVETEAKEDIDKLRNMKSLKRNNIKVELPRKRNPLMIVYDIPSNTKDDEIVENIYRQNFEDMMTMDQFKEHFKPKFKTGPKDKRTFHCVVEESAKLRSELKRKN